MPLGRNLESLILMSLKSCRTTRSDCVNQKIIFPKYTPIGPNTLKTPVTRWLLSCFVLGVHKVRHAIFANFDPLPHVTLCHTSWDLSPESTSHTSDPLRFVVGLVQKSQTKVLCSNSISIVRGGFCPGVFVWVGFCSVPLRSQYICYNSKLNIALNFMFHMYDKNLYKRDVTYSLPPSPLSQTVTPSRTPPFRA